MMKAVVNRIIPNTLIDGPGSRMAIFLQGCNMNCLYCHNPETQNQCTGCGYCTGVCPAGALTLSGNKVNYNQEVCCGCDRCIGMCPHSASPKCLELEDEALFETVKANEDFIDGVTLSGGECTLQYRWIQAFFSRVKAQTGLSCFIDTNGYMDEAVIRELCEVTDGFMFDLKALNKEKHVLLTGLDNRLVLENMSYVSEQQRLYEVRTVVVPGFTDSEEEIGNISEYIRTLNAYTCFKLIRFRRQGVRSILSDFEELSKETFEHLYNIAYNILGSRAVNTD